MFDRITFDPQIIGGRACIRGMRITVSVIVGQIAHGASFEEILEEYPDLEREDIQQAIESALQPPTSDFCPLLSAQPIPERVISPPLKADWLFSVSSGN